MEEQLGQYFYRIRVFNILFSFFLMFFKIDTIFIGQGLEHSIDMEMVDSSTYVPNVSLSFKSVSQK